MEEPGGNSGRAAAFSCAAGGGALRARPPRARPGWPGACWLAAVLCLSEADQLLIDQRCASCDPTNPYRVGSGCGSALPLQCCWPFAPPPMALLPHCSLLDALSVRVEGQDGRQLLAPPLVGQLSRGHLPRRPKPAVVFAGGDGTWGGPGTVRADATATSWNGGRGGVGWRLPEPALCSQPGSSARWPPGLPAQLPV